MKATLSNMVDNCSDVQLVSCSSGTCCVRHNKGPNAHSKESNNTDKLPDTAI